MPLLPTPNQFDNNQTSNPTLVNDNFNAIANLLNGNMDSSNIASLAMSKVIGFLAHDHTNGKGGAIPSSALVMGSGSGVDADMLEGFHGDKAATANTAAVRDANGKLVAADFLAGANQVWHAGNLVLHDNYIEFPNGVMVCWGTTNNAVPGPAIVSYPKAFVNAPCVFVTPKISGDNKPSWPIVDIYPDKFFLYAYRTAGSDTTSTVVIPWSWVAIGK